MRRPDKALLLVGVAFFLSGASALVYQVAWQRMLALGSGASVYSMALIVAAFMAGLGIGSAWGGRLSTGMTPRRATGAFAGLELAIAAFGAASPWLFHDVLYVHARHLYDSRLTAGVLHFGSLVVPTTLMGMSLPFLARAFVTRAAGAARTLGLLYGVNVLGASLGAFLTPWVLIRFLGISGAVRAAAVANLLAAATALLARRFPTGAEPAAEADADAGEAAVPPASGATAPFSLWLLLYGLSGFCALALEIVWFRVVDVAVRSTAFTFGTVLCLYLLGSAIGSFVGARVAPALRRPLRVFLLAQCALVGCAALALGLLVWLPATTPGLEWYVRYWRGDIPPVNLGSSEDAAGIARLYLLLPAGLFGLPTLLMGFCFPVLQRAVQDDLEESGRRVGFLQAANIAGCVLGSLLVGLLALSLVGTTGSVRLLLVLGMVFAAVGLRAEGVRSPFLAALALLAVLFLALPGQAAFWRRVHGVAEAAPALVDEDASGVGAIFPSGDRLAVMINGLYHSWLPFGGVHTRLGAFPAIVHPAPRDVAIIGLASGDTPWASGLRAETASITVFEIFRPQPRLLADATRGFPGGPSLERLQSFLADPRLRLVLGDGRQALASEDAKYDVIEADALWPETAWSGNLFSVEFFELCARRLKPGGLMCSWTPTPRIRRTFRHVFPYVIALEGGGISIGSNEPLTLDRDAWKERLRTPHVSAYLGGDEAVEDVAARLEKAQLRTEPPRSDFNHDLFPRDEFLTPDPGRGRP